LWRGLRHAGINPADCCPYVSPRWLDEIDEDSVHALATQLVQTAADFGDRRVSTTLRQVLAKFSEFCVC
jgi:hypothetical protein